MAPVVVNKNNDSFEKEMAEGANDPEAEESDAPP